MLNALLASGTVAAFAHKKATGSVLSKWTSLACLVVLLINLAPQEARDGAPFHSYEENKIAFISCSFQMRSIVPNTTNYCADEETLGTMAHCYSVAYPSLVPDFISMCREDYGVEVTQKALEEAHGLYKLRPTLNDTTVTLYRDSFDQFLGNYNRSNAYGCYMVLFWVVFLGVVSVVNWSNYIWLQNSRSANMVRRYLTVPAGLGRYKTHSYAFGRYFDFLCPTRLECAVLGIFFATLVFFCTHQIHYVPGDPIFMSKARALLRYYAVRTSCISSALLPLLILFGGRNNFLQWVTMWDYSTYIMLHRWLSRAIMVMVTVHAVCYACLIENYRHTYLYAGIGAFVAGVVIMVQGLLVLRRSNYELFLVLHILLALVFIAGAYVHVLAFYVSWFYYISAAIWLFDRLVRIARLVSFGVQVSTIRLYPRDQTLKVTIQKPSGWNSVVAGGHSFIHFLQWNCFWQSHPFTYTLLNNEIRLYIKVKQGVTYSLYKHLLNSPDKTMNMNVAVEGSYGEKTLAARYNHAVFVAGGNGMPGIYAEAIELMGNNEKQKITLVWVIRDESSLEWFHDELESLKGTKIHTIVYITRPSGYGTFDQIPSEASKYPFIEFRTGRPDMADFVSDMVDVSDGSTCFVTCGNPIMVDDLRYEVVQKIGTKHRVQYFEQLQVWS